jgi:hypothetical protein
MNTEPKPKFAITAQQPSLLDSNKYNLKSFSTDPTLTEMEIVQGCDFQVKTLQLRNKPSEKQKLL